MTTTDNTPTPPALLLLRGLPAADVDRVARIFELLASGDVGRGLIRWGQRGWMLCNAETQRRRDVVLLAADDAVSTLTVTAAHPAEGLESLSTTELWFAAALFGADVPELSGPLRAWLTGMAGAVLEELARRQPAPDVV